MKNLFEQFQAARPQFLVQDQLWSWEEIESRIDEKLQSFHDMGLKKGDIIAASGSKAWLAISWLACLAGGYIFCPVPPSIKNSSEPPIDSSNGPFSTSLLWFHENSPPLVTSHLFSQWAFLKSLSNPCALLKTSGTSDGKGRWVALESASVKTQVQMHADAFSLKGKMNQERLQALPLYHVFGLILDLSVGLILGQTIFLVEAPQLSKSWIHLAQTKTWDMALTPRLLHLLHRFYKGAPLGRLHLGGARVSTKLKEHARELFASCIEGYGLTECGPGVLLDAQPLGCEVKVDHLEASGASLGLLKVKSPSMGTWESKEQDLEEGWYNTLDLASLKEGSYQIVGRLDRSIKHLDGRWIWLDQLESEWETLLGLDALRIEMLASGFLQLSLLEEEARFIPELEKLVSKCFDLPIQWRLIPLQRVILTPDKTIFGPISPSRGNFSLSQASDRPLALHF